MKSSQDIGFGLTAVYFQDGDTWVGFVEELTGVNSQGDTLVELKKNLVEAARLVIEANRELVNKNIGQRKVAKEALDLAA